MKSFKVPRRTRTAATVAVALALWLVACGGGDNGGVVTGPVTATFAPGATPLSPSITMKNGAATGDTFTIEVVATGVSNLFGTDFHVTYGTRSAVFVSGNANGSVLNLSPGLCNITTTTTCTRDQDCPSGQRCLANAQFGASVVTPGELAVFVTRLQNQVGDVPGFTGTGLLLTLTFRATAATDGNSFDFDPLSREACRGFPDQPGCNPITLNWTGGTLSAH